MTSRATPLHALFAGWGAVFADQDGHLLPSQAAGLKAEHEAATGGMALFDGGDRGWIEIAGDDTRDFLQRILSSDLTRLAAGGGQWSAMLDGKGHWISDLLLYAWQADGERIGLDLPGSRTGTLEESLDRFRFGERLSWSTPAIARLLVAGPAGDAGLEAAGLPLPGPEEFAVRPAGDRLVLRRPDRGVPCLEVLGPVEAVAQVGERLHGEGGVPGGWETLELLRVEAFLPRFGADFDEELTLPEANEWRRASVSKGCYAGQEVVAKIHTYGEAPWQLCRMHFDGGPVPLGGAELRDEAGTGVGRVTSWAWSPGRGQAVGLALLRRRFAESGRRLTAVAEDGCTAAAEVTVPDKVLG